MDMVDISSILWYVLSFGDDPFVVIVHAILHEFAPSEEFTDKVEVLKALRDQKWLDIVQSRIDACRRRLQSGMCQV